MKKRLLIAMALSLSGLFAFAFHHGPCIEGNIPVYFDWGEGEGTIACCVPVGDGSELSCTDGEIWFNFP